MGTGELQRYSNSKQNLEKEELGGIFLEWGCGEKVRCTFCSHLYDKKDEEEEQSGREVFGIDRGQR